LDCTTYQRAPLNETYLPAVQWTTHVEDIPVDAFTFVFDASQEGYHFTLQYGYADPTVPPMLVNLIPRYSAGANAVIATANVPRNATYFLKRVVDAQESAVFLHDNPGSLVRS
jgi:hypothetical protein